MFTKVLRKRKNIHEIEKRSLFCEQHPAGFLSPMGKARERHAVRRHKLS